MISNSGNVALSTRHNQFVVDNARNGFDLYQLDTATHIRTFPTGNPSRHLPKQVAFGEDSKVVVAGSDHGAVYVFDRKTGKPLEVLHHADKGLVQTITVCECAKYMRS
jgi:outer membrane protein assembly factor BamB